MQQEHVEEAHRVGVDADRLERIEVHQAHLDVLDAANATTRHAAALAIAQQRLAEPDTTPSARVLAAMARDFDSSYVGFTRAQSVQTRNALLTLPFSDEAQARFAAESKASVEEQKRIEASDSLPFEIYRQQYLSPERLGVPGKRRPALA
jgi:glutamate--cysteine ligase